MNHFVARKEWSKIGRCWVIRLEDPNGPVISFDRLRKMELSANPAEGLQAMHIRAALQTTREPIAKEEA